MEIILLGIYAFFVWLIFIKLKLLPWTTPWKVGVAIFPVVAIATLLLLLNIFAPTTSDVRVVKYVVPIVSQVRGRVIEVPVENNRPVKKGDVLFRIDPTPYQNEVHSLEAKLASDEAKVGADRQRLAEAQAKLADAQSSERAAGRAAEAGDRPGRRRSTASLEPGAEAGRAEHRARRRRRRQPLRSRTVADQRQRADRADRRRARGRAAGARKTRRPRRTAILRPSRRSRRRSPPPSRRCSVSQAQVETTRAQLDNAQWELSQTTVLAPGNGTMVNVMLRPGFFVAGMPFNEVMTFVDNEYQIFALFGQNELHQVEPGQRSRDHARHVSGPHHQGARGFDHLGPGSGADRGLRRPAEDDVRPAAGPVPGEARGRRDAIKPCSSRPARAAPPRIYTEHLTLVHIIRKVLLRVSSYLDYIIIKHSISLGH